MPFGDTPTKGHFYARLYDKKSKINKTSYIAVKYFFLRTYYPIMTRIFKSGGILQ
jgi:hypothetical protein